MSEPYLASIRGYVRDFKWMLKRVTTQSARSKQGFAMIYLVVHPNEVETFDLDPIDNQSYCTFTESYFEGITLEEGSKVTAVVDPSDVLDALNVYDNGDFVELRFLEDANATEGTNEPSRASIIQLRGDLVHRILCPTGELRIEDPVQLRQRFTDKDVLRNGSNSSVVPVHICIPTHKMKDFMSIIDGDPDSIVYPLVIRDGEIEFTFFPEEDPNSENTVWGQISTHSIEGPDIMNHYPKYIDGIFQMLSGDVDLYTDPDEGTLAIVNKAKMGCTLRYVVPSIEVDIADSPLKWV